MKRLCLAERLDRTAGSARSGLIFAIFFLVLGCTFQFGVCEENTAQTSAAPDGKVLFAQHCAVCHGENGQGQSAITSIVAPNLQAEHNPGEVLAAVEIGPSHMPSFAHTLTVPEMRAVANYVSDQIAVIPLENGSVNEGGRLFRIYCAACHRTSARGGALAFTGINAPDISQKSAAMIAGAIRWGPGPMPSFPQPILSDQQLASIVDYVKSEQSPETPGGTPLGFYGPTAEGLIGFGGVFLLIGLSMWIEKGGKG